MKPSKCPAKEKGKKMGKKRERRGEGRKQRVHFKTKHYLKILLSVQVQTLEVESLHV